MTCAVITGVGVVSGFGVGARPFFGALAEGRSAVGPIRSFAAEGLATRVAGEVPIGAIDAESWKDAYGISEDFVQRVGTMLQPRDSALFVLARTINADALADAFRGFGGTVLRTTLTPEQRARVEATLHAAR